MSKRLYVAVAWDEVAVDSIRYVSGVSDDYDLPTIKRHWDVLDVVRVMHAAECKAEVVNYMEANHSEMPYVINEVRLG